MNDDQALRELNAKITEAENDGNKDWLASILAPKLAFMRADAARTVDDREAFLQKVQSGGERKLLNIGPIDIYGDRAIVQCIVKVGNQEFDNLRLFVRREGGWKLLGWANEPVRKADVHSR